MANKAKDKRKENFYKKAPLNHHKSQIERWKRLHNKERDELIKTVRNLFPEVKDATIASVTFNSERYYWNLKRKSKK